MKTKIFFLTLLRYGMYIFGIFFLIGGLLALLYNAFALLAGLLNKNLQLPAGATLLNAFVFLLIGFIHIKCAQGLKLKRKWGWLLAICILSINTLSAIYGIYRNIYFMNRHTNWLSLNIIIVLVALSFIITLLQKDIRELFI